MESEGRTATSDLTRSPDAQVLPQPAVRFGLFQAIRLLEALFPDAPRLGHRGPADQERIRLRPSTSFAFPASDVADIRWVPGNLTTPDRAQLTTNFFGLFGASSPIPLTYAQEVLWSEEDEPHVRDFIDLFHHRILSLLYRSWFVNRYEFAYEEGARDRLSRALLAMVGADSRGSSQKEAVDPETVLRYLGLLLLPSRPGSGLETLLSEELETTVTVEEFVPRWVEIPREHCYQMRGQPSSGGLLGRDIHVGTRMRDYSGCIKLKVGPVSYARASGFRPGGKDYARVRSLIRLYVRQPLDTILECTVPSSHMPSLPLGGIAPGRLGHASYIGKSKEDMLRISFEIPGESR